MEKEYASGSDLSAGNLLGISIEGDTRSKLQSIATWSKLTAIGGFVNMGLNIVSTVVTYKKVAVQMNLSWLIVTQLVLLAISFFLNYFLWQFSKSLKTSLDTENQESFVHAAAQIKAYMRMLGILLITSIVLGMAGSFFATTFSGGL